MDADPAASDEREGARLRDRLAEVELEHATLEGELDAFRTEYMERVGTLLERLHALDARPPRPAAAAAPAPAPAAGAPAPDELKRLFRAAAKRMHPDVVAGAGARAHGEAFMKRLVAAYHAGDGAAIADLLRQWEAAAPARAGDGPAGEQLAALRAAVAGAEGRLAALRATELAQLLERTLAASARGEDLLARMREDAEAALLALEAARG
ncbi:MAG TPA: hypothetical protein VM266_16620 [Solirubrobacteraceae bacterium]|nr:hypothetical protein [Solirubrobacteraceae bacterium]